jgi:hypothetical protein
MTRDDPGPLATILLLLCPLRAGRNLNHLFNRMEARP